MDGTVEKLLSAFGSALHCYGELLSGYSGKIRLTGPGDADTIWNDHILDCLHSVPLLPREGRVLDVGSGGGLPGMIWAICRGDLQVVLLDSVRKKCGALEYIASELGLHNVEVVWGRCEDFAWRERESFSLASARAVAAAGILAEYLSPLVSISGKLLAFKGPLYREEIAPLERKWSLLGLSSPSIMPYDGEGKQRFFLLWDKIAPCPVRFPRKAGTAEKNHWWR